MPPMNTTQFAGLLAPDLRRVYIATGKKRPPEAELILNTGPMEYNPVKDRIYSGLGTMPSMPEGQRFPQDQIVQGPTKTYQALPFGLACEITFPMWEDDLYGVMHDLIRGLALASRNRKEVAGYSVFNNAFSTSFAGFVAGEALCSTSHVSFADASIVQANRPSPDIGFSVVAMQQSALRFEAMVDARGLPRLLAPVMTLLHAANKFIAREILGSAGKPFTADNELNSLLEEDMSWMIGHYLTSLTAWFNLAAKGSHDLNFYTRTETITDSFDDPWSKNAIFSAYQRHMARSEFGQWEGVDGSTG